METRREERRGGRWVPPMERRNKRLVPPMERRREKRWAMSTTYGKEKRGDVGDGYHLWRREERWEMGTTYGEGRCGGRWVAHMEGRGERWVPPMMRRGEERRREVGDGYHL